jgi:hypothetical protein
VEAALDRPPRAAQAVDALQQRQPAGKRHAAAAVPPGTAAAGSGIAPSRWCARETKAAGIGRIFREVAIGSERWACIRDFVRIENASLSSTE